MIINGPAAAELYELKDEIMEVALALYWEASSFGNEKMAQDLIEKLKAIDLKHSKVEEK